MLSCPKHTSPRCRFPMRALPLPAPCTVPNGPRANAAVEQARGWIRVLAPLVLSLGGLAMLRLLGPDAVDQEALHGGRGPLAWLPPGWTSWGGGPWPMTFLPGHVFTAVGGMLCGTRAGTAFALLGCFFRVS
ncbi:uncharacterized protein STAUR_4385 [Stigmatella aurantiaca DW4/3-1]|uniref:Uncharacterized protein n=1 Tax=Stigmatella aurantiaca (strain DW4/3-1) TaxID=378806 RepID=E3FU25_STIAD|nr:uncharacterized protein STAUR_4385 [Stigmatella aurantiaca DW4/3-1]